MCSSDLFSYTIKFQFSSSISVFHTHFSSVDNPRRYLYFNLMLNMTVNTAILVTGEQNEKSQFVYRLIFSEKFGFAQVSDFSD